MQTLPACIFRKIISSCQPRFNPSNHRLSILNYTRRHQYRNFSVLPVRTRRPQSDHLLARASMTQPHDEETLRRKINSNLHQAFFEDSEDDPLTSVLYNFADGNINTRLAADDIISSITRSEDSESSSDLSTLIIFLASEYPFLQPQLVDLIRTILSDPVLAEESKSQLSSDLVVCVGDTASSNFARLFEEREMTNDLIDDHVNLHRFLARLLSLGVGVLVQMEDIFYMLSVGLEDHAASGTTRAGVDARTAAQYLIHAAEDIFDGCEKG